MTSSLAVVMLRSFWDGLADLWHPVWALWWAVFGVPISAGLKWLVVGLSANPVAEFIGPFGLAIILLTIAIKLILSPIFQYQLVTARRVQAQQRKIAPQLAAIRKKYRKDPQRQNQEVMAFYREHGINPFAQMSGCLPALVQTPILVALYWAIFGAQASNVIHDFHFLWIAHLDQKPVTGALFEALLHPAALILPVLAGLTTYVSSKMLTPPGGMAGQDPSQAAVAQSMTAVMPVMIGFFSTLWPAALPLYWVVSNLFAIGQQYFITGWGSLRVPFNLAWMKEGA